MRAIGSNGVLWTAVLVAALVITASGAARAETGGGKRDEAIARKEAETLRQAIPEATRFESSDLLLDDELLRRIEQRAKVKVKERMVTFYTAWKGDKIIGYVVIHSHVVRTKNETFALAFHPDGRIRQIQVVSFLEPQEYLPTDKWLAQFQGKGVDQHLAVGDDILPISGATMSARGVAQESRWILHALKAAVLEARK